MVKHTQGAPLGGAESRPTKDQPPEPLAHSPAGAGKRLGVSTRQVYVLIASGERGRWATFAATCACLAVTRCTAWHYTRRAATRLHVHVGLTFSGCLGGRRMKRGHWFGFDCAHSGDLVPGMVLRFAWIGNDRDTYRSVTYVRAECTGLAEQLARKAHSP